MKSAKRVPKKHRGAALIISMIFILIFSVLAVSVATLSNNNVQIADNQHRLNITRSTAESGLEVMRYWIAQVYLPGDTTKENRFAALAEFVEDNMAATGLDPTYDEYSVATSIQLNNVQMNSLPVQTFSAILQPTANLDILQMDITGTAKGVNRTIRVNYNFGTRYDSVFDYGVATRGRLILTGNTELGGVNVSVESDVYIESFGQNDALSMIGNSQIAGDVKIVNPEGCPELSPQASVGGETAPEAYDHIEIGAPATDFPVPLPNYFLPFVEDDIDMNNVIHENVRIPAGTNPDFPGGMVFKGVVFIEAPNIVTFTGLVEITGIIVGNGDLNDNSPTNQITFNGTVSSHPVSELPDEPRFEQLKNETGTFLMTPGFRASFGGNFETINGAIAANGIDFWGNAGGTINGSVVNYSDEPMTISGNSDLFFNRSGNTEVPAGFGPQIILHYDPMSYSEVF